MLAVITMSLSSPILRSAKLSSPRLVPLPPLRRKRAEDNGKEETPTVTPAEAPSALAQTELEAAREEAAALLAEARAEADRLLAEAAEQAAALKAEAEASGWQKGLAEGTREAEAANAAQAEALRSLLASAAKEREEMLQAVEREMVTLILAVVSRIVHDQASVDREMVARTLNAALKRVGNQGQVRARVNPIDLATLTNAAQWRAESEVGVEVEFVADETIAPGGCLLEVGSGTVDARVESQLAETVRYFESMLAGV